MPTDTLTETGPRKARPAGSLPLTFLKGFMLQEEGAIAVIVALSLTVLLAFAALGVDVAALYRDRAALQATSDLSALSAVADLPQAEARATAAATRNGRRAGTVAGVERGRFLRNPELPPETRFTALPADAEGANAVRIRLSDQSPLYFAQIMTVEKDVTLTGLALAVRTGAASFSLSSHLLRLEAAGLSEALSARFGAKVQISAGQMQVLGETYVDLAELMKQLGEEAGLGSRNPAAILDATTTPADLLSALRSLLPDGASGVLGAVQSLAPADDFPLEALAGGIDTQLGLTVVEFLAEVDLSALDVLHAIAGQQSVTHPIDVSAGLAQPGVLETTARLTAGEPPARSGWIALGERGVQLHRAAARIETRLSLAPDLLGVLGAGVSVTDLSLPIIAEVAGATARLAEIDCTADHPQDLAARFVTAHRPLDPANGAAVAALYLGDIAGGVPATGPIDPRALDFADILELSLSIPLPLVPDINIAGVTLQARSHVTLGRSQEESILFTKQDVREGRTRRNFGSAEVLSTGLAGLLDPANTELRLKPGQEGLLSGVAGPLLSGVMNLLPQMLLTELAGPVDQVLDATLAEAGIRLGEGELTLTGHHCERARLVQ
ncbi:MAG: TadG family pilus assembly protein [Sulfitobacter sp.]|nr:TadG family pilus assembly protein [Sulfitobacter sp.]